MAAGGGGGGAKYGPLPDVLKNTRGSGQMDKRS